MASAVDTSPVAPVAPVSPRGIVSASAPDELVNDALADEPADPVLTLTELTRPVVASRVLPSEVNPKILDALVDASSTNSGVVILLVFDTLKDRSSSSYIS